MDAKAIEGLEARLRAFLSEYSDCFGRHEPADHLRRYVRGQLSDLPRKSVEPIALQFGTRPRTLQQFLSHAKWDEDRMRQRMQEQVSARYSSPWAVGIIDETSYVKKGEQTPAVQRQHCGAVGKKENCVVTVHLAYAAQQGLRVLLDGELFLPEGWSADRERCRKAGIPDSMVYRPKWKIALELLERAVGNGVGFAWLTADEGYGRIPEFHQELDRRGQPYVVEVPRNFYGWCQRPEPLHKEHHPGSGRKLKVKSLPPSRVDDLVAHSPRFIHQAWKDYYIKDGTKGPIIWQAKNAVFYYSSQGMPSRPHLLIVARNALDKSEVKYFVSNAALNTPEEQLLAVGFRRYAVERCFEDDKSEVGMDHFEVRNYLSLKRHLIISALSLLFLSQVHREDRGEKCGTDGLSGADGRQCDDLLAAHERAEATGLLGNRSHQDCLCPAAERPGPQEPPQADASPAASDRDQNLLLTSLSA
jgi:SRSO17 transposase